MCKSVSGLTYTCVSRWLFLFTHTYTKLHTLTHWFRHVSKCGPMDRMCTEHDSFVPSDRHSSKCGPMDRTEHEMIEVVFQESLFEHIHDSIREHVSSTIGTSAVEDQSPKAQSLTSQ